MYFIFVVIYFALNKQLNSEKIDLTICNTWYSYRTFSMKKIILLHAK